MRLQGNKYVNHSFFRPYLFIYDNMLVYKKRRWVFFTDEITVSYNHVVQVNLHKGIWFAKLDVVNTGAENVTIKGVWRGPATKAKKVMDQKIYEVHNKEHRMLHPGEHHPIARFEKNLRRLKELVRKGKISRKEYEKKKKRFLKEIS